MRFLPVPVLALFLLSACSSYQYIILGSSQLQKNDKKQFIWETDTLRLTYDFNGDGGPISINIYNKSDKPLYVNWKKSAIIRDGHSISLYNANIDFSGSSNSYRYRLGALSSASTNTSFSGSFTLPEGTDFIPPASSISKGLVAIAGSGPLAATIPDTVTPQQIYDHTGYKVKYRQVNFEEDRSPIRFKSYLTFSLGANNTLEFAESNSFYAGGFIQSNSKPEDFTLYEQQGDRLFVRLPAQ